MWRKARAAKTDEGWPVWVNHTTGVKCLFDTMEPFVDEDAYDVAKAFNINAP